MKELNKYRRECLSISKDFNYPEEVIQKIHNAKNETQLSNIMADARRKYI